MSIITGSFNAEIVGIDFSVSAVKPAIFTRLKHQIAGKEKPELITHVVRLSSPKSMRYGLDELRNAFPSELGSLTDNELIEYLLENTSEFVGKRINIRVEHQMKQGIIARDDNNQPYFNVRLESAVKDLSKASAKEIARSMLSGALFSKATKDAVKDLADKNDEDEDHDAPTSAAHPEPAH